MAKNAKTQSPTQWGEFPQLTAEEAQIELKLDPADIAVGESWMTTNRSMSAVIPSLKKGLDEETTKPSAEGKLYGLVCAAIKQPSKMEKMRVTNSLSENHIFKRMSQSMAFALAVKSIRENDHEMLGKIVGGIKKEHPFHPDLTIRKSNDGQSLGHYAARCDQPTILKELVKTNPSSLETQNTDLETVAHTASRFGAWHCLDYLVETRPELFARPNKIGETPLDLEGGRLIRTKINPEQAQAAEKQALEKKERAREVLAAATLQTPKEPMVNISKERGKVQKNPTMNL